MNEKATAPMVKSAWPWSGGSYADSDALARMTENLNPMEVAQAALDSGIPTEYYLGNIPSQWAMTGENASAYSRFLDSIGKLKAMDGNSMHVGNHPVRGSLDVPVVRSGKAVGNLAEQEAAMLTRIAEIDGLLTDRDTVRQWKDFDTATDHTVYGQDAGGHLVHPNYNADNYVNPLELDARAAAAQMVAQGKLAEGDAAAWVEKAVAGRRQELLAERGRLNAAEEALRNGPMRKFVKPIYDELTHVDAGGDVLTRTRMQAAGVPLGKADGSAAAVGTGLASKWGDFVHDHNPWGNWLLDNIPGTGWLAGKLGAGSKGSDLVRIGPQLLMSPVNSSLQSVDDIRQGDRASAVNRALEGTTYTNKGTTARVINDMRSNNGEAGTGDQGSSWWSTSWIPGIGNIGLNAYFGGKLFGMTGGARTAVAGAAEAPVAKTMLGRFVKSPSVQNTALVSGLQLYDGYTNAARHGDDVVKTKVPKSGEGGAPTKTVPEARPVQGNGVTLTNAGEAMAARGKDAFDAEVASAVGAYRNGKEYVPGEKGVSGVNREAVESYEKSLPEGGGGSVLSRWWNRVKGTPWPWVAGGAAALGGGMLLGKYLSNRRKERERKKPVRAPQVRSYPVPGYSGFNPVQAPQLRGGWSGDDPFDFYTGDFYY